MTTEEKKDAALGEDREAGITRGNAKNLDPKKAQPAGVHNGGSTIEFPTTANWTEAAASYLEQGVPVFPLHKSGKDAFHPYKGTSPANSENCIRTVDDYTNQKRKWFAIPCGQVSGIVVVDVDVKGGSQGLESLTNLLGGDPRELWKGVPCVQTKSGGWHFYFSYTDPLPKRMGILPGVDLCADGQWVFCPPMENYKVVRGGGMPPLPVEFVRNAQPAPPGRGNENVTDDDLLQAHPIRQQFNKTFAPEQWLVERGYPHKGKARVDNKLVERYLSPLSKTKNPGVMLFLDSGIVYTHHGNDALEPNQGHDSFALWAALELGIPHSEQAERMDELREKAAIMLGEEYTPDTTYVNDKGEVKRRKKSEILLELARAYEYFRDNRDRTYALMQVDGHQEVWNINIRRFHDHLRKRLYALTQEGVSEPTMKDVLDTLRSLALSKPVRPVYRRVAKIGDKIYFDLVRDDWQVVEINPEGWRVVKDSPVHFVRDSKLAEAVPIPVDGHITDLRPFVNVSDQDFPLVAGWLVHTLCRTGPRLHLGIMGEQGTAKSTLTRMLKALVDPSSVPLRSLPKDEENLLITAESSWVLAIDNVSSIRLGMADALCRMSTGGGFGKRELYTDGEEFVIDAQRNVILNGISTDLFARPDLAERTVILELEPIQKRIAESELWEEFQEARPKILGALFTAASYGLSHEATTKLTNSPRMIDAMRWIVACENDPDWQEATSFLEEYERMQEDSILTTLDYNPVARLTRQFMSRQPVVEGGEYREWNGTASELKAELEFLHSVTGGERRPDRWPADSANFGSVLKRVEPSLRLAGITISKKRTKTTRALCIRQLADPELMAAVDWPNFAPEPGDGPGDNRVTIPPSSLEASSEKGPRPR